MMRVLLRWVLIVFAALAAPGALQAQEPSQPQAVFVEAADGVRLAVDVIMPPSASGARAPSVLVMTRYGRRDRLSAGATGALLANGFAVVLADMRGSGASFGHVASIFSDEERRDIGALLDWVAGQPWSDGRIVVTGASHDGNLAELAVLSGRASVVAAIPRFIDYDTYEDLALPGGVRNEMIMSGWGNLTRQLDTSEPCLADAARCVEFTHLHGVDADPSHSQLRAALLDHQRNWNTYLETRGYAFADDHSTSGRALASGFLSAFASNWQRSTVREQLWASWLDARTADSALARFAASPAAPLELVIGAWAHGGGANLDPLGDERSGAGDPNIGAEILGFALDAVSPEPANRRRIRYYTMGAGWRETAQWPPRGPSEQVWWFGAQGALTRGAPRSGADIYDVDFSATTGVSNRWATQLGGGAVAYADRAPEDAKLLTYTSAALIRDIEITGTPVVELTLSSTRTDGAVFVYLEAIDPSGRSVYLTEGQRRLGFRAAEDFSRASFNPPAPGEVIRVRAPLATVSAVVRRGWRLRVAVAGADQGTFARYPDEGAARWTVRRGAGLSRLILPQANWTAR